MHPQVEVLDDALKLIILVLSAAGAWYARKAHQSADRTDKAVNGVADPEANTIRENVQELHDEVVTHTPKDTPR